MAVYPEGRTDLPYERPVSGLGGAPTPRKPSAVIVESDPAVRAALEYLLVREGYAVEARDEAPQASERPVLVLASDEEGHGLHVFKLHGAVTGVPRDGGSEAPPEATGIRAFVPKPFGALDVLRVVRAVSGFDVRKKNRPKEIRSNDQHREVP